MVPTSPGRFALYAWMCTRLTTRGLLRWRLRGLRRSVISSSVALSAAASREGGKSRLAGDLAADYAQRAHEGQPVGVDVGLVGRLAHEVPDCVMSEQESPDFLPDHLRRFRSQHPAPASLMSFQLIEAGLELPALSIGSRQFRGARLIGIHDRGDEAENLIAAVSVGHFVLDDPDGNAGRLIYRPSVVPLAITASTDFRVDQE